MKLNIYIISLCIILFLIVILLGVLLCVSTNKLNKASDRIDQLMKIKQLLDTQGKTEVADLTITTKSLEQETLEFVVDYNRAQETYINLLQGLLKNNGVSFPVFEYDILLEEISD